MKKIFTLLVVALTSVMVSSVNAATFTGFEVTSSNKLSNQIHNEHLVQNLQNMALVETDTVKHHYSINLINPGNGSFSMGDVVFLFSSEESGKTAYKTYDGYIQPNGMNREIRIPTVKGEHVIIALVEDCPGMMIDGESVDLVAGENHIIAKGNSILLVNPNNKPKFRAIKPLVQSYESKFWNFSDAQFNTLDTIWETVTVDGLTMHADPYNPNSYMVVRHKNVHVDGCDFTHFIKTHGTGREAYYSLSFDVEGPCMIDVYTRSQSTSESRTVKVDYDEFGNTFGQAEAPMDGDGVKQTFYYTQNKAGKIYLYGAEGGIVIFAIRVTLGGQINANSLWKVNPEVGKLAISGNGAMTNYESADEVPWRYYEPYITSEIEVENGITQIGRYSFNGFSQVNNIIIPSTLKRIGKLAFEGTAYFEDPLNYDSNVFYADTWLVKAPKTNMGAYTIKANTVGIADDAFYHCANLDLRSIQFFGLHPLKGCHVYRKLRMILRIIPCHGKLLPNISGQVLIRSLPSVCQRVLKDYSGKLFGDLILALARKLCHIRQIHLCLFR